MPALKLEVFETGSTSSTTTIVMDGSDLEEARLASYEQGYAAGWDDSVSTQADDQRRLRADLARNLQAMSFTYHEARSHVLRAIGPLLQDMTTRILPAVLREALAPVVIDTLMPLAEELAGTPVIIILNPASRSAVEALLEQTTGLPVTLRDEPSLGEGQVFLQLGDTETRIDLDRVTAEITAAIRGFFELNDKDRKHG
jgi:flagellar biosynthesis/type III secretory pathway protein FliH